MCKYQGGKQRIGREIHDVILKYEEISGNRNMPYFEPFVGMCGVMKYFGEDKIHKLSHRKLAGNDLNTDVILMWKGLQNGWIPPTECTEQKFNKLKKSKHHSPERGFIGTACSFGGAFFSGFRGKYQKSSINDAESSSRKLLKMLPSISSVKFTNKSYDAFHPKQKLIYCDPPYRNSEKSANKFLNDFDSNKFWEIMRMWSRNNIVIISEEKAPKDFKKIWGKKVVYNLRQKTSGHKRQECLFMYKPLYRRFAPRYNKIKVNVND